MQTRRTLLASSAGAAALALGSLGFRAWDRGVWSGGDGPAYAPWKNWQGSIADRLKRPLRAAILASNPHDTQPWLFQIGDNAITLFADRARNLGAFDPFRREMHLGLGAAVENLVLAARAFGFAANVTPTAGTLSLSPDDTPASAAHIALAPTQPRMTHFSKRFHAATRTAAPIAQTRPSLQNFCAASPISQRTTLCALSLSRTRMPVASWALLLWKRRPALSAIHKCLLTALDGFEPAGAKSPLIAMA